MKVTNRRARRADKARTRKQAKVAARLARARRAASDEFFGGDFGTEPDPYVAYLVKIGEAK